MKNEKFYPVSLIWKSEIFDIFAEFCRFLKILEKFRDDLKSLQEGAGRGLAMSDILRNTIWPLNKELFKLKAGNKISAL